MSKRYVIKKACINDIEEILSVMNTSDREAYRGIIPKEYFRDPFMSLEGLLKDLEKMTFYIYKTKGKIVGVAALQAEDQEIGWIWHVFILPEYQGRGIGTKLMSFLEHKAREVGLKRLRLRTGAKKYGAANFYRKLGYNSIDKVEVPWGFVLIMEKNL